MFYVYVIVNIKLLYLRYVHMLALKLFVNVICYDAMML